MVKRVDRFIYNLEGILYHKYTPLMYFKIVNRQLIDWKTFGWEPVRDGKSDGLSIFKLMGVSYESINEFFRERVVDDGAYEIKEYLELLGLDHYDFEGIIKSLSGWEPGDSCWLKFNGGRFQSYDDILELLSQVGK